MGGMNRKHSPKGFSLVELLVVIALIAIVTRVSLPAFWAYTAKTNLKTAVREVMGDLANAKQRAVEENLDLYRLTFDVSGSTYVLSRTDTGAIWTKSVASLARGVSIESVSFSGGSVVSFNKRGTVSAGNVTLKNGLGAKAKISINITGRTYVEYS